MTTAKVLSFDAPYKISIQSHALKTLQQNQLLIKNLYSAISAGTELLVYRGNVPHTIPLDATLSHLSQPIRYPLSYGYASVGYVEAVGDAIDPQYIDQLVFSFSPHGSYTITTSEQIQLLPKDIAPEQATLLASMETALSVVMDAKPVIAERVAVFGLGTVGLLVSWLLSQFPVAGISLFDPLQARLERAHNLIGQATQLSDKFDLAFDLSAQASTLNQIIPNMQYDGRILVGSWYGNQSAHIQLGDYFHRNHIQLMSSQVSHIAPDLRGRFDRQRRLDSALRLLQECPWQQLVSHVVPLEACPTLYHRLDQTPQDYGQVLIRYEH